MCKTKTTKRKNSGIDGTDKKGGGGRGQDYKWELARMYNIIWQLTWKYYLDITTFTSNMKTEDQTSLEKGNITKNLC